MHPTTHSLSTPSVLLFTRRCRLQAPTNPWYLPPGVSGYDSPKPWRYPFTAKAYTSDLFKAESDVIIRRKGGFNFTTSIIQGFRRTHRSKRFSFNTIPDARSVLYPLQRCHVHRCVTPREQRPTHITQERQEGKNVDRRYNLLHLSLVVFSSREWVSTLEPNGFASSQFLLCKQDPTMFEFVVLRFPVCQTIVPTAQATT